MIRLKVTPVVGLPQFTGWSQVAESTSSASTRLISVFAISGKHAGNVGRDVSDKISDFYYYDVEQLHEFIQELVEFVEENSCELFISCALINGDKSVFITKGGSVFLKRKEKIGKILFSQDQIKIVSGSYTNSDVFVLTTLQASQFLNEIEQKFSQGFDVDIIITSVVPGLHAQTDSSLSAIVFINQVTEGEELAFSKILLNKDDELKNTEIEIDDLDDDIDQGIEVTADLPENISSKLSGFTARISGVTVFFKKAKFFKNAGVFAKRFFQKSIINIRKINLKKVFFRIKSIRISRPTSILSRMRLRINKKFIIIIVGVLIVLGIFFSIIINNRKETERINSLLLPIQSKLMFAQQELNSDPISSRDITLEIISSLEALKKENENSRSVSLIDKQLLKASNFYDEISGKDELDELEVFYDLRLVKSDYIANNLGINDEQLVLLDSEKKQIVSLNISTKKVGVRDFSEYKNVKDLVINNNEVIVLSDGIRSFELKDDNEIKVIRELGDSNRNGTFINAYDHFVYVLSPDKRNVYRYSRDENGDYSDPIGWMKSATGLKYNEITSFSVDGDIWLSTIDGQIKKFSGGQQEDFSIRGLSDEFSSGIKIFTNINQENIYVLEADKKRIVILSKTGDFIREIKSVSLAAVSSIAVSEKLNKIFAVSGSIVFEIPISL